MNLFSTFSSILIVIQLKQWEYIKADGSSEDNDLDNSLVPNIDDNLFNTKTSEAKELRLIFDGDRTDGHLDDLSESSGDFDTYENYLLKPTRNAPGKRVRKGPISKQFDGKLYHYEKGDWIQFKYLKSFKLIPKLVTKEEAETICQSYNKPHDLGAQLAVPQSEEENRFITEYVFKMRRTMKNVWIGQMTDNYRNVCSEQHLFWNWGKGFPTMTKQCIQIRSPFTAVDDMDSSIGGKWEDVSCLRHNLVLCEKPQPWTDEQIIRVLIDLKKEVYSLKNNPGCDIIPKGFTYTQLPGLPSPKELWPTLCWKDISLKYANLFFRVVGNKSEPFGRIQVQSSPRLNGVKSYGTYHSAPQNQLKTLELPADDKWTSDRLDDRYHGFPVGFRISGGEVRPMNTAVKIWEKC